MRVLFLDLASHDGCIACCNASAVLALEQASPQMRDDALVPAIERVLAAADAQWDGLTHVACVSGPGGFTSLRVGVMCANTLVDQLRIPAAGVHLSDFYRARCNHQDVLWLHSTRRHELFVRGFGRYADVWPEATLVSLPAFVEACPENALWMGECIPEHASALAPRSLQRVDLHPLAQALPGLITGLQYTSAAIEPWYGRGF